MQCSSKKIQDVSKEHAAYTFRVDVMRMDERWVLYEEVS
jgi:hypothetical protein